MQNNVFCTINHDIAFVERWNSEMSSFHLPQGEMSNTLDDVSCLLHLPIRGRILNHCKIVKDEAVEMMVTYLGADLGDSLKEVEYT